MCRDKLLDGIYIHVTNIPLKTVGTRVLPKPGTPSEHWLQRRKQQQKRPKAEIQTRMSIQHHCKDNKC